MEPIWPLKLIIGYHWWLGVPHLAPEQAGLWLSRYVASLCSPSQEYYLLMLTNTHFTDGKNETWKGN